MVEPGRVVPDQQAARALDDDQIPVLRQPGDVVRGPAQVQRRLARRAGRGLG